MSAGPRRLGKYELQGRLGLGGMAEVWKALDTQLQRYVAIKFLHADWRTDPDFMTRFVREAQAIASLHHPNIVQVHDFQVAPSSEHFRSDRLSEASREQAALSVGIGSQDSSLAYMVMNYIEGPTLAEYIGTTSRIGAFPSAAEIVHLFTAIGSAIDYAHQRGMVHRDIKPANILLDKQLPSRYQIGEPILTDFGIVKLLGVSSSNSSLGGFSGLLSSGTSSSTLGGTLLGTPRYMAPEQAQGRPGNEYSDIYSLGVILYEICTGMVPFAGDNPTAIMIQHIFADPPRPTLINPNIPLALEEVILRCLAKDPAARFPSASSLSIAITEILTQLPAPTPNSPLHIADALSGPIAGSSSQLNLSSPQGSTPSLDLVAPPDLPSPVTSNDWQSSSTRTAGNVSGGSSSTDPEQRQSRMTPVLTPSGTISPLISSALPVAPTPSAGTSQSARKTRRRRAISVVLIALVLLVLISAGVSALYLVPHTNSSSVASQIVGQVLFSSSGHLEESTDQGIEDELQIDLQGIPNPTPGRGYYAWLLSDKDPPKAIPLGLLTINHGRVSTLHRHDQQYTNLLAITSRFLITEEDIKQAHATPSLDHRTWRYYAEFPQTLSATVLHSSVLDHLRNLLYLYEGHFLPPQAIRSALAVQFLRNVYQVFVEAKGARDAWDSKNALAIHEHVVRVLDYLEGTVCTGSGSWCAQKDVSSGPSVLVDPALVQLPLLDFSTDQYPAGYFSRFDEELQGIIDAPGVTPDVQVLANKALATLPTVQDLLMNKVHRDAKQLVALTSEQLLQDSTRSTLADMEMQASYAYAGQGNPSTNQFQAGALWIIINQIQRLAALDVRKV